VVLLLWMAALSCWYMRRMQQTHLRYGRRQFYSTWIYSTLSIHAVVKISCNVPNDEYAPNTMQVPPTELHLGKKHDAFLRPFQ
jgi:hypothetical protein